MRLIYVACRYFAETEQLPGLARSLYRFEEISGIHDVSVEGPRNRRLPYRRRYSMATPNLPRYRLRPPLSRPYNNANGLTAELKELAATVKTDLAVRCASDGFPVKVRFETLVYCKYYIDYGTVSPFTLGFPMSHQWKPCDYIGLWRAPHVIAPL